MKKYDAVIAGYICVDLIPQFKRNGSFTGIADVLKPGRLIEIDGLSSTLGGVVANTGLAMTKFSKKVYLNGLIGDDFIGDIIRQRLNNYDILTGVKVTSHEGTAFGLVIAPSGIDRIFLESPGCSQGFAIDDIDFDVIAQSRLFHFGYPPLLKQFYINDGAQLHDMFASIHRMGVVTSLDFSLPDTESESGKLDWAKILYRMLPFTDVFVPSLEEALQIMLPDEYSEIVASAGEEEIIDLVPLEMIQEMGKRIIDAGTKVLLIKAGHRGAFLWTGNVSSLNEKADLGLDEQDWNFRQLWCKAYPVDEAKFRNASGAGDTASAAFLSALLDGENTEQALKYATLAGRNNLYCFDIYSELSSWPEMTAEIKGTPHKVVNLKSESTNPAGLKIPLLKK